MDDFQDQAIAFLKKRGIKFDHEPPTLPTLDQLYDLSECVSKLNESKLYPICAFGDWLLLRGSSGKFYLTGYIFKGLGMDLESVATYLESQEAWESAEIFDLYGWAPYIKESKRDT